jgi:hypothetical protein
MYIMVIILCIYNYTYIHAKFIQWRRVTCTRQCVVGHKTILLIIVDTNYGHFIARHSLSLFRFENVHLAKSSRENSNTLLISFRTIVLPYIIWISLWKCLRLFFFFSSMQQSFMCVLADSHVLVSLLDDV